jgi:opacity protein-like surface antigen
LPVSRIADVEAVFHKHDGSLTSLENSSDSFEAGASTEAFMNLSEKFSLHGRLEYMNFNGKDMVGPVMMNPSYNPLNFYESTDKTPGSKNRESYNLAGGFSYALTKNLSV